MSPLFEIIRAETANNGAIPFARFMELALYCPVYGYYEREKDNIGRAGDFFTNVSIGPLFGEMLAFQFAEWMEKLPIEDCRLKIVEAGAHDGKLAADVLKWLRKQRNNLFEKLEYCIIEPSDRRRGWQRATLVEFGNKLRWFAGLSELGNRQSAIGNRQFTVIFSNELLDAFPVHRLGWDARNRNWFEWGVTVLADELVWTRVPLTLRVSGIAQLPSSPEFLAVLPEGFTTEISPGAEAWWRQVADILQHGKLMTIDYGLSAEEFFHPERSGGTLRGYYRHQIVADILANAGEQDLTAHVNFTALQSAGEGTGLRTETFASQAKFLTGIAEKIWKAPAQFGEWTPTHTRQFQTLTHPEHLGRPFRVLVQSS